ncbi:threonylcarbamoyl-AMP synthase [Rhodovulum sulfidophilum]|uniref:L-threonylcarbamoyladenylate synthase n=1 Tax=Rhodovulum sulfidophilum TaxID=35806 RepID=UPI001922890D|nr:L-threonylcarbamoyladenylate synthase [Rhodovulum sulfidophilum]MBL3596367.1 threonylcarbamoyl-AMP synthase [Rhodovulum sulfidophilum]
MSAELLRPDTEGLARAATLLAEGRLVALPTETVYGLGADARNDRAVAQIFEAKGRPRFNPLIVHLPDLAAARHLAVFSDAALRLAEAFWPGALTLVLPLRPGHGLSPLVSAGLPTVALRVPDHPVAQGVLSAFGGPVAAPSANVSGAVSPTRSDHVIEGLGQRIAAVVEGGACPVGVESTILGLSADDGAAPVLLRPGGLPTEAIEACLGQPLAARDESAAISAPGQLGSHYAPGARVVLNAATPPEQGLWLGFGPDCPGAALNLSPSGDLVEAAAALFHALRQLDARAAPSEVIAVAPIPEKGLGRAINDRLRRAAAPRPGQSAP